MPVNGSQEALHAPKIELLDRQDADWAARSGESARIIIPVWGDRYVGDLLALTIPALLAPGNLPAFARDFDCELVIVTETRLFERIARSDVIAKVKRFASVRLLAVDDLLSPWYGITLTYALVRGFVDLGEAMTRTHLLFLNADFIVADGSYRRLAEKIKEGTRLVVSPSYCMNLEGTVDVLTRRRDRETGVLAMPARELASLILDNRHNTIRAKTINQRLFRIHRYDQLYWYVDEKTLLCRQMPIAVIYMRPERVLTEMPTFWDYGVISEYCPQTVPTVLGDSDDFLMAELRSQGTFRELLGLGWPTVEEIAEDLSSFTTQDHRDYGRYTLSLHAGATPPDIATAEREFAAFSDRIYAAMKPPIDYRNHPFWAAAIEPFTARREEAHRALLKELLEPRAPPIRDHGGDSRAEALRWQIRKLEDRIHDVDRRVDDLQESLAGELSQLEEELRHRRTLAEEAARTALSREEEEREKLREELALLQAEATKPRDADALAHAMPDDLADPIARTDGDAALKLDSLSGRFIAWCGRFYRRAFGRLHGTTPWHPYHAMLRPLSVALARAGRRKNVLIVSSGGSLASSQLREQGDRQTLTITPGMLGAQLYKQSLAQRPRFDLCLCDLAADDLLAFRDMLAKLCPTLADGARVIVFHNNIAQRRLDEWTYEFTRGLFPIVGCSQISFAGSSIGALSVRRFARSLAKHDVMRPAGLVSLAVTLAFCAPLARLASVLEKRHVPYVMPRHCTSMTIEIVLP
jgi:hypothetical protein